ncbi:hypothetical protein D3C85_1741330 [compost metagenome]
MRLAQQVLLNLVDARQGQGLVAQLDTLGAFETGNQAAAMRGNRLGRQLSARRRHHHRVHSLAPDIVGDTKHRHLGHSRARRDGMLHL